jgi:hypothetical protein
MVVCFSLCGVAVVSAQQKGQYVPGQFGLNAGVVPDPGFTYENLALNYSASTLNNANGNRVPAITGTYAFWVDENILMYVPKHKFLGGYFAPWISLNAFFAPTGRYTLGASDNVGSGYWGNDLISGTTAYLTKNKGTSANLLIDWEHHGTKRGTNETPGQTFTMEWGLGQALPRAETNQSILFVEEEEVAVADHFIASVAMMNQQVSGRIFKANKFMVHLPNAISDKILERLLSPRRATKPTTCISTVQESK